MSPDATHEEGIGRIPPQVGPQADRGATAKRTGRRMVLPPAGGCDGGGGIAGKIGLPPSKYGPRYGNTLPPYSITESAAPTFI